MKKFKKWTALGLAAAMVSLTACGGGNSGTQAPAASEAQSSAAAETEAATEAAKEEASGEKITLTVWQDNSTPEREEHLNKTVEAYMADHPNINVVVTSLPNAADQKVEVAFGAGEGPDIFFSSGPRVSDYISAGYIIPLDDYFDNWEGKDRILPKSIEDVRRNDITGEDKIWYLPLGTAFYVLWVRSDWLKEAGASVDTWEHLFEAVPKITDKANGRYGIALRGGNGGPSFLERMMYSYSGIDSVFDENGKATINDPKHVEFVERYLGMYGDYTAEGDINYGWTELSAAFDSGSAGIIIHNLGSGEDHMKAFDGDLSKFEAVPLPKNADGKMVTQLQQEAGLVISSTCEHPDEAFELGSYLATGESVSGFCRLFGLVPVDSEVLENDAWIQELPWYAMAAEQLENPELNFYNYYPWLTGKDKIYTDLVPELQLVMAGEKSAQEFLDEWNEAYEQCYADFYNK